MKNIIVQVKDETTSELVERVEVNHLSDLGEGVKEVVEDFVEMNKGAVLPPVSIQVVENKASPNGSSDRQLGE
jgi:hypothetical protein